MSTHEGPNKNKTEVDLIIEFLFLFGNWYNQKNDFTGVSTERKHLMELKVKFSLQMEQSIKNNKIIKQLKSRNV